MKHDPKTPLIGDFNTDRLSVRHVPLSLGKSELARIVEALVPVLSPVVLEHLPTSLKVEQNAPDVAKWLNNRLIESDVLMVHATQSEALIGLLMVVDAPQSQAAKMLHIGYLFAQKVWGNGYASELVDGLVKAARSNAPVALLGGVAKGNVASAHILRKLGFMVQPNLSDSETDVFALAIEAT